MKTLLLAPVPVLVLVLVLEAVAAPPAIQRNQFTTNTDVTTITIGTGSNTVTLGATNAQLSANAVPIAYWVSWSTPDTNVVFVSGSGSGAVINGRYALTNGGAYLKTGTSRTITNFGAAGFGLGVAPNFDSYTNSTTTFFPISTLAPWSIGTGLSPSPAVIWGSNYWASLSWSGKTNNMTGFTNGEGGIVLSNGTAFLVVSRVGATNQTTTLLGAAP